MKGQGVERFINNLIDVVQRPELHMREIPILIGLSIPLIFIVLILIAIFFVRPEDTKLRSITDEELKRSIKRRYIVSIVLGVLTITFFSFTMAYSSKPEFCAGCHAMKAAYEQSKKTTHKDVGCLSCHQGPGISGVLIEKLELAEVVIAQTGIIGKVTSAPVSNEACLRCHKDVVTEITTVGTIRVKHKEPLEASYKCTDCHFSGKTIHAKKRSLDKFGMSRCVDCHNNKRASAECYVCHTQGSRSKTHINQADYPMVGLPGLTSCKGCHSTKLCMECHSLQVPHPEGWESEEHAIKGFVERKLCMECHDQAACQKCHTGDFSHGDEWVKQHGPISKASLGWCANCHKIEEFCVLCHVDTTDYKQLKQKVIKPKKRISIIGDHPGL